MTRPDMSASMASPNNSGLPLSFKRSLTETHYDRTINNYGVRGAAYGNLKVENMFVGYSYKGCDQV